MNFITNLSQHFQNTSIWIFLFVLLLLFLVSYIIGYSRCNKEKNEIYTCFEVVENYGNLFQKWAEESFLLGSTYAQLTVLRPKIEEAVGLRGYMFYKPAGMPPGTGYTVETIPLALAELADRRTHDPGFYYQKVRETLFLRMGELQTAEEQVVTKSKQPLVLMRYGFRYLVMFPVTLLNFFGLITDAKAAKWRAGSFANLLTFLVFLSTALAPILKILSELKLLQQS